MKFIVTASGYYSIFMSQSGGEDFPLDSTGETINDDTHFLETWEVSEIDKTTHLTAFTSQIRGETDFFGSLFLGNGRAGGRWFGQSYRRLQFQQGADWSHSEQARPQIQACQQPGMLKDLFTQVMSPCSDLVAWYTLHISKTK